MRAPNDENGALVIASEDPEIVEWAAEIADCIQAGKPVDLAEVRGEVRE